MDMDVLVVGESLVDRVDEPSGTVREHPGGSAANVAVALARLGCRAQLATSFADDHHGRLLAEHLAAEGVTLAGDPHALASTSTATATIDPDGSAHYDFAVEWQLLPVATPIPAPQAVHTCSIAAVLLPGADDVLELLTRLRGSSSITYDVNARPALTGAGPDVVARVERVVAVSDLVKASDEDLDALYPGRDHLEVARGLIALGPAAVVVTRGSAGAMWVGADLLVEVAARPVTVVDTIGAGDTFGAALIDGLGRHGLLGAEQRPRLRMLDRATVEELLAHAAAAAAVTVSRPGADPPYARELEV